VVVNEFAAKSDKRQKERQHATGLSFSTKVKFIKAWLKLELFMIYFSEDSHISC
jgi:hypothetical protein